MQALDDASPFRLGCRTAGRIGHGAMQLAGPGVFGPPEDRTEAVAVLRAAVESGASAHRAGAA